MNGSDISSEDGRKGQGNAAKQPRIEEERLVRKAQEGDMTAFEGLYRTHVGRVYALCLRISGDAGRAEELTQEVFVRTWQKLASFRGRSAFSSWLHRLSVNVVLGGERSSERRMERMTVQDETLPREGAARQVQPDERVDLEGAIASLPPGARKVFVLHDIEGYKHEEIASLAGISEGTSKAHLHRARQLLREALGK